jgi:antitoxin component of MazEF toxin-antitoxin module
MYVKLVHIGNSMGVRIPKNLIKQFDLDKGAIESRCTVEHDAGKQLLNSTKKTEPLTFSKRSQW